MGKGALTIAMGKAYFQYRRRKKKYKSYSFNNEIKTLLLISKNVCSSNKLFIGKNVCFSNKVGK